MSCDHQSVIIHHCHCYIIDPLLGASKGLHSLSPLHLETESGEGPQRSVNNGFLMVVKWLTKMVANDNTNDDWNDAYELYLVNLWLLTIVDDEWLPNDRCWYLMIVDDLIGIVNDYYHPIWPWVNTMYIQLSPIAGMWTCEKGRLMCSCLGCWPVTT